MEFLSFNNLLLLYNDAAINDEELLMLTTINQRRPQLVPDGPRLDFNSLDDDKCVSMFRFDKPGIRRMKDVLRIPEKVVCSNSTVSCGVEALCITLRRLAYPSRLADLVQIFGRTESEISLIFNTTLEHIYSNFGNNVTSLDQRWLQPERLNTYSEVIHQVAPLDHCWGFIDGTLRPITRPGTYQEFVYSGHKRTHGLKFQSIMVPNGIIANLYGPLEGKRHDAALLRESNILPHLEQHMNSPTGHPYSLYGDTAYPLHSHLIGPFRGPNLMPHETEFNKQMSSVRQCVEWGFNKIVQLFAFLDFKKNLKLYLQPVGKYYIVGCFLTNCHTCLYGSTTSTYFGIEPPLLEDYVNNFLIICACCTAAPFSALLAL